MDKVKGGIVLALLILFFISIFLWANVFGENQVLSAIGCYLFFIILGIMIIGGTIAKFNSAGKNILLGIFGFLLTLSIFFFFCAFNLVPGMPSSQIYLWFALPLILCGGGGEAGTIIIIIKFN